MSARDDERLYHEEGVTLPETPAPSTDPPPWRATHTVGKRRSRIDGYERLSGAAVYPSDVQLPGMLHAAFLRCPHPHARLRSLDTRAARALPGVHAVIDDTTPEAAIDWNYQRGEGGRLFDGHARFEGAPVAAVAAETPHLAREAVEAMVADWEVLPHVADARDAATLKELMDTDLVMGYAIQTKISRIYFNRYLDTMKKLQSIVMNLPVEA